MIRYLLGYDRSTINWVYYNKDKAVQIKIKWRFFTLAKIKGNQVRWRWDNETFLAINSTRWAKELCNCKICKHSKLIRVSFTNYSEEFSVCVKMLRQKKSVRLQQFGRVIDKYGNKNVYLRKVPQKSKRYVSDIVTTIVSICCMIVTVEN